MVLEDGRAVSYDKLLIATGAKPRRLTIEGGELAYTLRDFADGDHLRSRLRASASAAIVGGGFIGLEVASSARKLGCSVTLIEAQPRILMRGVPEEIAKVVHARHVEAGVTMEVGTALKAVETDGVRLADDRKVKAEIVIAGIGAAPEVALAQDGGACRREWHHLRRRRCGRATRTSMRRATAAPSRMGCSAASACGSRPGATRPTRPTWRPRTCWAASKPYLAVPWFWSDQYDLSLQIAGSPADGASDRAAADWRTGLRDLPSSTTRAGSSAPPASGPAIPSRAT